MDDYITAHPARFLGNQSYGWVFLEDGRRVPVDRLLPLDIPDWETEKMTVFIRVRAAQFRGCC